MWRREQATSYGDLAGDGFESEVKCSMAESARRKKIVRTGVIDVLDCVYGVYLQWGQEKGDSCDVMKQRKNI